MAPSRALPPGIVVAQRPRFGGVSFCGFACEIKADSALSP
jgi:hypothetical protein